MIKGISFPNWNIEKLIGAFADSVLNQIERQLRGFRTEPFEAVKAPNDRTPSIWSQGLEGELERAKFFAMILNEVTAKKEIRDKKRLALDAWKSVEENRDRFLKSLKEMVIEQAKGTDYTDHKLWDGECEDCKDRREKLISLGGR